MGEVVACPSVEAWNEQIEQSKNSKRLVVIDFTATWCGPCRFMAPVFVDLAKKYADVLFLKVDVDQLQDVAREFGVEAMPTFVFWKEGSIIDRIVGARKEDLAQKVATLAQVQ